LNEFLDGCSGRIAGVGTTAFVRDYVGSVLYRSALDVREVLRAASAQALPLLGNVDEYDDTVFNALQLHVISGELDQIARESETLSLQLQELQRMVARVQERPHRYLVFNGD
jgi:hypothetical protein